MDHRSVRAIVWGNHQERLAHAGRYGAGHGAWRRHVIVEAAPIVPHDEDNGVRPQRRILADPIDDGADPVLPADGTLRRAGVIGEVDARRFDPRELRQVVTPDIRFEIRPRDAEGRTGNDFGERIPRAEVDEAIEDARRRVGAVVPPTNAARVQRSANVTPLQQMPVSPSSCQSVKPVTRSRTGVATPSYGHC